jgi:hypothetical protein
VPAAPVRREGSGAQAPAPERSIHQAGKPATGCSGWRIASPVSNQRSAAERRRGSPVACGFPMRAISQRPLSRSLRRELPSARRTSYPSPLRRVTAIVSDHTYRINAGARGGAWRLARCTSKEKINEEREEAALRCSGNRAQPRFARLPEVGIRRQQATCALHFHCAVDQRKLLRLRLIPRTGRGARAAVRNPPASSAFSSPLPPAGF